jgi:CCR4-NOT transcriptional regulation complex NOT5 subunit
MIGDSEMHAPEWLRRQIAALKAQIREDNKRKKSKGKAKRKEFEDRNQCRKWHMDRLELILQRLDNGSLSADQIFKIQEDVNSYVKDNAVRLVQLQCEGESRL